MRHSFALSLVLSFSIYILTSFSSVAEERDVVRLTNGEWPPYLSEKLPHYGAASHIVVEAFQAVGVDVEYVFLPWSRSYRYAVEGVGEGKTCHGSVVWVYTPDRAKNFNYSEIVVEETEVLFHLKSKPLVWREVEDLRGKIIGGTQHTAYPFFEKAEEKGLLTIQRAGNYDTLFQRLLAERIDAVPQVRHVGKHFMENNLTEDERNRITFSETVVDNRRYHLIFSKKGDPEQKYLNLFNKGLELIRDNGAYDSILQDLGRGKYYGVQD